MRFLKLGDQGSSNQVRVILSNINNSSFFMTLLSRYRALLRKMIELEVRLTSSSGPVNVTL